MFKDILLLIAGVILCFIGFELIEYAVTFIVGAMSLILIICGIIAFLVGLFQFSLKKVGK